MPIPELPLEGGCRCGRVRFRINQQPMVETICHCHGCQRMSASAFSTTLIMPEAGFAFIAGETVIGGMHSDRLDHHHCDWCKSWVYTKPRGNMGIVNVRATLLDDASWFVPWMETQTDEKLPWAKTSAARSFPRFPAFDKYQKLIADYQAERNRQRRPANSGGGPFRDRLTGSKIEPDTEVNPC